MSEIDQSSKGRIRLRNCQLELARLPFRERRSPIGCSRNASNVPAQASAQSCTRHVEEIHVAESDPLPPPEQVNHVLQKVQIFVTDVIVTLPPSGGTNSGIRAGLSHGNRKRLQRLQRSSRSSRCWNSPTTYRISCREPRRDLRERDRTVGKKFLEYRRILCMKLGMFKLSISSSWTLVSAKR